MCSDPKNVRTVWVTNDYFIGIFFAGNYHQQANNFAFNIFLLQPNTFQAALMTDGIFSFVIFNYMEDEMLWNTDLLYYKDAIIGYGDGNGIYDNTHLQSPFTSVTSRYRPDQLVGNTNLQGRWYFRLENNTVDTLNHKQQCLDWYHRQPDPSTWSRTLGTCPCGFQQGRSDNTYSRSRSAELNQVDPVYTTTRRFDEELLEAISGMEG